MTLKCVVSGAGAAWRNRGLVFCFWIGSLIPAILAAAPLWFWWSAAFNRAPEADRALNGLSLGLLRELVQYDRSAVWGIALTGSLIALLLSTLANPLFNGGAVEVLLSRDQRPFLSRFFSGAGRYYLRYLALLLLTLAMGGVAVVVSGAVVRLALRPVANSGWVPGAVVSGLSVGAVGLVVASFFYMVLDYARIHMAMRDSRRVVRDWIRGLHFVARHFVRCAAILGTLALFLGALFAAYTVYRSLVPSGSWTLIALTFVVQQLFTYLRVGLRTSLLASELELYRGMAGGETRS